MTRFSDWPGARRIFHRWWPTGFWLVQELGRPPTTIGLISLDATLSWLYDDFSSSYDEARAFSSIKNTPASIRAPLPFSRWQMEPRWRSRPLLTSDTSIFSWFRLASRLSLSLSLQVMPSESERKEESAGRMTVRTIRSISAADSICQLDDGETKNKLSLSFLSTLVIFFHLS